ncbi:hypothetical protein AB4099_19120 [Bosea sp. 2KB_26]|uniref:hypothetical protein n=1 Tax=Bosea sp. 2KB_26 TaxID=3237475 RepID=UPI003F92274B
MTFLSALWGRFAGHFAALGALLAILIGAYARGRREGKETLQAEQERGRREAIANKRKLEDEVDNLAPADVDRRLNRWVHKDGR